MSIIGEYEGYLTREEELRRRLLTAYRSPDASPLNSRSYCEAGGLCLSDAKASDLEVLVAVKRLPVRQRQVIEWWAIHNYTLTMIARQMRIELVTAEQEKRLGFQEVIRVVYDDPTYVVPYTPVMPLRDPYRELALAITQGA